MEYEVIRTDTADAGIRKIILYIAQNFGNEVALEQLDYIEKKKFLNLEMIHILEQIQDTLFLNDKDIKSLY